MIGMEQLNFIEVYDLENITVLPGRADSVVVTCQLYDNQRVL